MPRLLLEGRSLTELLAQVRAEHGPEVTIVAADKIRTRGIGGFFARESYALTVEVAETGPDQSLMHEQDVDHTGTNRTQIDHSLMHERIVAAQEPGSLLDLAAAIDAAEVAEQGVILATAPMHATTPAAKIASPALSTASPEFSAILARLTALDAPPVAPAAPETTPPSVGTGPQADAYTRLREVLTEIAPHLDFSAGVPLVLVLSPAVSSPAPATVPAPVTEAPAPAPEPAADPAPAAIPQQGRHRRAAAI